MCGIFGFIGFREEGLLERMSALVAHRGPDGSGLFEDGGVSMGSRRLAIVDPERGGQPLLAEDRSAVVVFNGEIYNHSKLRSSLEGSGYRFSTRSDTEVVLACYRRFGTDFARHLVGDFAIAIWDSNIRQLVLVRDRLGVHPLYIYRDETSLLFGSELKCLLASKRTPRDLDLVAVDDYLTLRYVPGGKTLFRSVEKLHPGTTLVFREDGTQSLDRYWDLPTASCRGQGESVPTLLEAEEELSGLLHQAVRLQSLEANPLGLFLSGGIDSTLLAHLAMKDRDHELHSFSFGSGTDNDELAEAQAVASAVGSNHHVVTLGKRDYELLPKIVWHLDDPLGDSIIIANYRLAQEASRFVKVVLSGEGADEVWGGYVHHLALSSGARLRRWLPNAATKLAGSAIEAIPEAALSKFFPYPASLGQEGRAVLGSYIAGLGRKRLDLDYLHLGSAFREADKVEALSADFRRQAAEIRGETSFSRALKEGSGSALEAVLEFDLANWLPDYTLLRQDKLGLANGVEVRVPYLDHRIVEFAATLPPSYKILGSRNKRILRRVAARSLGASAARTPKKSFVLPIETAFDADFDDWARDLLGSRRSLERGIVSPEYLAKAGGRGRSKELVANKQLMVLIVLELWFQSYMDGVRIFG